MHTEHRFISFDETPIFYSWQSALSSKKAVLILMHGMGEHGGRYRPLSDYLARLGLETYVPDLRGHGKSGGPRGHVNHWNDFYRDLEALHLLAEKQNPGLPIFILGHSFGGLVAAGYITTRGTSPARASKIAGLVLSSPLFGIFGKVARWRHLLAIAASRLAPRYTEKTRVNPASLTHDKLLLERYSRDPLIHYNISARLYAELTGLIQEREKIAKKLETPFLLLQAGDDRIVSKEAAVDFFNQAASGDKEMEIYDGFYHEILNEIGRQAVFDRLEKWLLKHI